MADNTTLNTGSGGDVIATDDLSTLNGNAVSGVKAQRVKVGFGSDASFRDVDASNGLPIIGVQDSRSTGTITTASSVAGSVSIVSRNVVSVDISGTYAGVTFITEASPDGGTTWYPVQGVNNATGQMGSTWTPGTNAVASYDIAVGGFTHFRVRATAWTSGTANVGITTQTFAYDPAVGVAAQGLAASGSAVLGNPVLIGGSDGTNARSLSLSTTGELNINELPAAAAAADALANPTISQVGAYSMVFNGTSWDRQRGMGLAATTGDTGAKTATGNGATQTNVGNKGVSIVIALGAVSGATPTCTFKVQSSVDGGTNWVDIPGAVTASLTTGSLVLGIDIYPGAAVTAGSATTGTKAVASQVLPRTWRLVWTIGGTTPSFTITSITYNYIPN